MTNPRDNLYIDPLTHIEEFNFDQHVVDVFPDMIQRSVPGYSTIIHMIGSLAKRYATDASNCYDLGCSLGAATLALRHNILADDCTIVAVDNSAAMIARCQQMLDADKAGTPVTLVEQNILQTPINNASIVALNFTLQFIPLELRIDLLENIFQGLNQGGILIISEKVAFVDAPHQLLMTELHHNFKRANGYSDLEISQKRAALENILIPETLQTHTQRLRDIGFKSVDVWFQCLNFASIIAIK